MFFRIKKRTLKKSVTNTARGAEMILYPVKFEMKVPVPLPLMVFVVKEIEGFAVVDHTTPLVVTNIPPSDVIVPSIVAVVAVTATSKLVCTSTFVVWGDP